MGSSEHRSSAWSHYRPWLWLLVPALYLGLTILRQGVVLSQVPNTHIALWPGSGLLAAGLIVMPRRQAFWSLVACIVPTLVISLISTSFGPKPWVSIGEGWVMAALSRRLFGPHPDFSEGRKLAFFLATTAIPVALAGTATLQVFSSVWGPDIGMPAAIQWFGSHALGAAIFVPAVTVTLNSRRFRDMRRSRVEFAAALAGLCGLTAVLMLGHDPALWFAILPILMLVSFRYGPVGSAGGGMIIAAVCVARIYYGQVDSLGDNTLWMQFFIALVFLTALPTGGAVASYVRTRSLLARRTLAARASRRQADAAAAAKGEFLANMSHEIRTPLNGVIGLADALSRTELAPGQREMLKMILTSGKALNGLLSDALDLAGAETGELKLAHEPFDVRKAVYEAAYLFENLAREKGLNFQVNFDLAPPGAAVGDVLRIKQVLSNLISNAVKFTSRGSVEVDIRLRRGTGERGFLLVVVRDTGPGFSPEVKARLFSRFEQGGEAVTRRYGGTGLGLAIARRLAHAMGGAIECDAVPGRGAVFNLRIPIDLAAHPIDADGEAISPQAVHHGPGLIAVLLAEDNPTNQKVVQALLSDIVDLTVVPNGQAAVDATRLRAFDAILMDTHMPVMDGLTAIGLIRAEEAQSGRRRTPVISLTADAMPQQVAAALAAGADLHVPKPITAAELIEALRVSLEDPLSDCAPERLAVADH